MATEPLANAPLTTTPFAIASGAAPAIHYPESDGREMGQTDIHGFRQVRLYDLLKWRYRGQ